MQGAIILSYMGSVYSKYPFAQDQGCARLCRAIQLYFTHFDTKAWILGLKCNNLFFRNLTTSTTLDLGSRSWQTCTGRSRTRRTTYPRRQFSRIYNNSNGILTINNRPHLNRGASTSTNLPKCLGRKNLQRSGRLNCIRCLCLKMWEKHLAVENSIPILQNWRIQKDT